MEKKMDRSKCNLPGAKMCTNSYAPKVPTDFGIYVAGVCGKTLKESDLPGAHPIVLPMSVNILQNKYDHTLA